MFSFNGKKVLITGASYGIGLEMVKLLLQKGAFVSTISRTAPEYNHQNLKVYLADLALNIPILDPFYDVVMLNVGYNPGQYNFDALSIEEINKTIFLNVNSHLIVLKSVKCNKIVFVDSILSIVGIPNNALYCSSKAFISVFNEALRREGKDTYIIYPYKVNTTLFSEINDFLTLDKCIVAKTVIEDVEKEYKSRYMPAIFAFAPFIKAILPTFILDFIIRSLMKFLTKSKKE